MKKLSLHYKQGAVSDVAILNLLRFSTLLKRCQQQAAGSLILFKRRKSLLGICKSQPCHVTWHFRNWVKVDEELSALYVVVDVTTSTYLVYPIWVCIHVIDEKLLKYITETMVRNKQNEVEYLHNVKLVVWCWQTESGRNFHLQCNIMKLFSYQSKYRVVFLF